MSTSAIYHVDADNISPVSITDKCIILDLDQTLIATQDETESLHNLKILSDVKLISLRNRVYYISVEDLEKPGIGTKYDFWGVTRPHIHEFLIFCFSYFKIVAVWSAGKRYYVEAIVDHIFKDLPQPHVVLTYDDIITAPGGHVQKPLTKMIELNPVLRRLMSLQNSLALDDTSSTFFHNQDNGILIPAYDPSLNNNSLARDDPTLLQLKYWLLQPEVVNCRDVATLDKSAIFSTSVDAYKSRLQSNPGYKFTK